jgi:hypothetical protein
MKIDIVSLLVHFLVLFSNNFWIRQITALTQVPLDVLLPTFYILIIVDHFLYEPLRLFNVINLSGSL